MKKQVWRILLFSVILTIFPLFGLSAQTVTVSGHVYDTDGKTPLPGVSVVEKASLRNGTSAGADGDYRITVKEGSTLLFSFLGYEDKEIVVGRNNVVDVIMTMKTNALNESVVTALGIKREEKSLGYSVAKVQASDLNATVSGNWLNGMAGKVAGLNYNYAGAGPGGSIRVTLRGESSINPANSEALFVIDGVPVNSGMDATGDNSYMSSDLPVDFGNGASDLNPEDIENVTVLKGPAATALYGSRAANGAIVITTKAGRTSRGIGVSVSSSATFEDAGYWPDFQNEYGSGNSGSDKYYSFYSIASEGVSRTQATMAWGPRFEGQLYYQYGGQNEDGTYTATPWVARDWYKGFFRTGITFRNTVSIDGSNGKGSTGRVSFTDTKNDWITPNSGYRTQSLSMAFTSSINRFVKLEGRATYYHKKSDNLPMAGYGSASIMNLLMWSSPSVDVNWYKDYWVKGQEGYKQNRPFNSGSDSPYLQAYEQLNTINRDRVYGTAKVTFTILAPLTLMLRTSLDTGADFRTQRKPFDSSGAVRGKYKEQNNSNIEINNDFLLRYDNKFGDFGVTGSFGGNLMAQRKQGDSKTANQLDQPGIYNFANSQSQLLFTNYYNRKRINSLYGMMQFSWRNMIYVDVTGRNDWSSTLAKGHNSYFYPSVSSSFLLSDILGFGKHAFGKRIDMLKLRLSWAKVGNDTYAYNIGNYYGKSNFTGGLTIPSKVNNDALKPEMVESYEYGLEGRFFEGRLDFDVTYYNAISRNQILRAPIDPITGYSSMVVNAGEIRNHGWEVSVTGKPVSTRDFKWSTSIVWSMNRNRVKSLADGLDQWIISQGPNSSIIAKPGGTLGDMYGTRFKKAPEGAYITLKDGSRQDVSGEVLYDGNGYPIMGTSLEYLGNTQAKWKAGFNNSFSFRGVTLSVSIDGQYGGKAYSLTNSILSYSGKLKNSLEGRYDGLIGDGVCYDEATGTYSRNRVVTDKIAYYYDLMYRRANVENNLFSTSFIKLREVRLEYSLPKRLTEKTKVLQKVSLAVYGRNLAMLTSWPQYDPEIATLNGSQITTGFETAQFPMTRSYGFSVELKF